MSGRNALLRPARPEDLASVLVLLRGAGLPVEGVAESFQRFVVAESGERIVGAAGLEVHGADGLLRSVAVAEDWRGRGLGGALTAAVLDAAARDAIVDVYLLTETAGDFFPRHGFARITRDEVAPAVRASVEFTELCPSTSTVMVRRGVRDAQR